MVPTQHPGSSGKVELAVEVTSNTQWLGNSSKLPNFRLPHARGFELSPWASSRLATSCVLLRFGFWLMVLSVLLSELRKLTDLLEGSQATGMPAPPTQEMVVSAVMLHFVRRALADSWLHMSHHATSESLTHFSEHRTRHRIAFRWTLVSSVANASSLTACLRSRLQSCLCRFWTIICRFEAINSFAHARVLVTLVYSK